MHVYQHTVKSGRNDYALLIIIKRINMLTCLCVSGYFFLQTNQRRILVGGLLG